MASNQPISQSVAIRDTDNTNHALKVNADGSINTGSYGGSSALTVGTAAAPGRALAVVATVAGNVSATLSGGSTLVFPVPVGLTIIPLSVSEINSSGTTATATYANLS